jgi:hypothetical protein
VPRIQARFAHGPLSRIEAESILGAACKESPAHAEGMFLIRESEKKNNAWVLSLCHEGTVHHYLFRKVDRGYEVKGRHIPAADLKEFINFFHVRDMLGLASLPQHYVSRLGGIESLTDQSAV